MARKNCHQKLEISSREKTRMKILKRALCPKPMSFHIRPTGSWNRPLPGRGVHKPRQRYNILLKERSMLVGSRGALPLHHPRARHPNIYIYISYLKRFLLFFVRLRFMLQSFFHRRFAPTRLGFFPTRPDRKLCYAGCFAKRAQYLQYNGARA